jgi:alpha-L-fucosidase
MTRIPILLLVLALHHLPLLSENFTDLKPSPQQAVWQDLEIGALIHFGPNTFMDREWGDGTADPKMFNPAQLNADQWVTAAKAGGARYLVMVAKHHDGFCLWPSRHTDYGVKSSPWREGKGDLVREVADACRKHGLKFGVYLSPWDRHEPSYKDNKAYDRYYEAQVLELAMGYGELVEFWLDGAGSEGHVYDFESYAGTLRTFQPNTLFFAGVGFLPWADIRWVGNEDGSAFEDNWNVIDLRSHLRWRPAEADTPLREGHWFWHPNDEKSLKPLGKLLDVYHKSVGRGAQLVLGLAPDKRGLMPEVDVARLSEFGAAIRGIYSTDLARGRTVWTPPSDTHTVTAEVDFRVPVTFDRTVLAEWIHLGQHVHRYDIQAWDGSRWNTVHEATTIGHKKIDIFPRTTATRMRVRILQASDTPRIRVFQVFDGSR